jgi:uncharacterized protein
VKFLIWLIIGAAVVTWLLRNKKKSAQPASDANQSGGDAVGAASAETMLQCRQCGLHIPGSEAIKDAAGVAFCSEEHHRQHFSDSRKNS